MNRVLALTARIAAKKTPVKRETNTPMKPQTSVLVAGLVLGTACWGRGQTVLQFSTNSYNVAESAGAITISVQRSGDTNAAVNVDYATVDGTATNGMKYTAVSGPLTFESGETNKAIVVPILDDGLVQGSKYFRVILSNPTAGATLGARTNVTVSFGDNDFGIQFQFAANSVMEDAGTVVFRIVRDDDGILPVTVDFFTTDLTATSGLDYTGTTNTLSFAPQERLKLVPVPILNNTLRQADRIFRARLANPVNNSLGAQKIATVTIRDNDQGFQFDSANYTVVEDAGILRIAVLRGTDDTSSLVSVDVGTSDLTATNALDYTGATNTIAFAAGEMAKVVAIPILNNGLTQPARTFRLTLSNPSGGAVLGAPASAAVKIIDNDPGVGFERASYSVWENAGSVNVTVIRGNDVTLDPFTVDYATSDSTATAGQDYQAVSGTIMFDRNETVRTMSIPILRNDSVTNDISFQIKLSNPTGGVLLGTAVAKVNILNVAEPGAFRVVAPLFDTALSVRQEAEVSIVTWAGGGQLQRSDKPSGPWQTLSSAVSPYSVQSPVPATFYRVTLPRPVNLYIPTSYDGHTPLPLVFLLHGYTWSGVQQENWMRFQPLAESRGFLYCYPDSSIDRIGEQFWSGTDACCDQWSANIDDVGYLRGLIEEIARRFAVDRKRVYLIGHSNGGYLSYHTACQNADLIAAIASVAGSTFLDPGRCAPSEPVNILQVHGTADEFQFYWGGANNWDANLPPFPSAPQSVEIWAEYNGASEPVTDPSPTLDLTTQVAGLETVVTRYTKAPPGGAVELWTMNGATHWPTNLSTQFAPLVMDWLLAHPKP